MKRIYVMLTKSNTVLATFIRKITRTEFSHSSLALDDNMSEMYSFARVKDNNPFVGRFIPEYLDKGILKKYEHIGCLVFMKEITDEEYAEIVIFIDGIKNSEQEYKFNIIGLIGCGVNKPFERKYRLCCSQFVSKAISCVHDIDLPRHPMSMHPNSFRVTKGLRLVYSGPIKDMPHPFTDETLVEIEDKTLPLKEIKNATR